MKVVFCAVPAYGHLYPMMPLALACAAAGDEVLLASGAPFAEGLPLPTAQLFPPELTIDTSIAETRRRHPEAQGLELSIAMFGDVTAGAVAPRAIELFEREQPDLVIFEGMNSGAGMAAVALGIPALTFAISLARSVYTVLHPATVGFHPDFWSDRGLEPPAGPLLGAATVDPTPPGLATAYALPGPTVSLRSVGYTPAGAVVPAWLSAPAARPRVYLTLGTVSYGAVEVLHRALDELGPLGLDILVAVGPDGDPAALGEVADGVRLERFVDQPAVLRRVDLVVHHGGSGTVLGAMAAGIPQLLLPQGADQFANAEIISAARLGRALLGEGQHVPGAIGQAVEALLAGGPERDAAAAVREQIAAMPGPDEVAAQLAAYAAG